MSDNGAAQLCLVGCGAVGRVHWRAVEAAPDRVRYAACFDADAGRAAAFAAERGGLRVHSRWEDVLRDPALDAVDLCVPHSQHVGMALEALSAGKHVFLEKPMALSTADCDRMIAAARERGLQLSVMHNRRFGTAPRAVKAMLDDGALGDLVLLTGQGIEGPDTVGVRSWLRLATEGGVGMAQTVHFAYMARWLAGPVEEVSCLTSRKGIDWMEGQVTAVFQLRFASGAVGQLASTFAQAAGRNVHRIALYGGSGQVTFVGNRLEVVSPAKYGDAEWHVEQPEGAWGADFTPPLASFGDAIRGRGPLAVPPEEGREAVAIIEAGYRSAAEGRAVKPAPLPAS
jgi:predicted dehydrogenase